MNERQKRFSELYSVSGNATQSAVAAGYAKSGAASQGERLLRNDDIKKAISKQQKAVSEKTQVTAAWVVSELEKTYHRATKDKHHVAAIKCLELLGKTLSLFSERLDTTCAVTVTIIKPDRSKNREAA